MTKQVSVAIDFTILSNFLCVTEYREKEKQKCFPFPVSFTIGQYKVVVPLYNTVLADDDEIIYPDVDILIGVNDKGLNTNYRNKCKQKILRTVYRKTDQVALLTEAAKTLNIKNYYVFNACNSEKYVPSDQRFVLIKPELAAEGLDHFILDTTKIDPITFINTLKRFSKDEEFIEYLTINKDAVSHYSGLGLEPKEEAVGILKNATHARAFSSFTRVGTVSFSIQEIVQDIKKEYRVILDKDKKPVFIVPRLRKANQHPLLKTSIVDYKQGYGEELLTEDETRLDVDIAEVFNTQADIDDFNKLVQSSFFEPVSSIDLFVCEDGRWGIFEFNPQFGLKVYPLPFKFKLHMNYIKDVVAKYLRLKV